MTGEAMAVDSLLGAYRSSVLVKEKKRVKKLNLGVSPPCKDGK